MNVGRRWTSMTERMHLINFRHVGQVFRENKVFLLYFNSRRIGCSSCSQLYLVVTGLVGNGNHRLWLGKLLSRCYVHSLVLMCRHLVNVLTLLGWNLPKSLPFTLVPFLDDSIMCYCFVLHACPASAFLRFRYVGVIEYVFHHVGVLVCWFVFNIAVFGMMLLNKRLSNSKLHLYIY